MRILFTAAAAITLAATPAEAAVRASALVEVTDVERAVEWYSRAFNLRLANSFSRDTFEQRVLIGPDLIVEIVQHKPVAGKPDGPLLGVGKFGYQIADLDAELQRLAAAGLGQSGPVIMDESIGLATFLLRDPDGNIVQLFGASRGPFALTVKPEPGSK